MAVAKGKSNEVRRMKFRLMCAMRVGDKAKQVFVVIGCVDNEILLTDRGAAFLACT
jgi:hypothetical protein